MIEYTTQQLSAIDMIKNNNIGLLFGGPGTGKTTATLAIIEWAQSENLHIIQAAPTGKAAKRMMEATNCFSSTIHTMLGCLYDEKNGFVFVFNKNNPIPCDLLIIDEVSMITNDLMARTLEAVDSTSTKVLLVGDPDQLPSVGAGAILRDLLKSNIVPRVELTIIHRNSGEIVRACHAIKQSKIYQPKKKLDLEKESPDNLIHIECLNPDKIIEAIKVVVCERMPVRGYNPVDDVQVISPVNTKGPLSCENINNILRDELNPEHVISSCAIESIEDSLPPMSSKNFFEKLDKLEKEEESKGIVEKNNKKSKSKKNKRVFRVGDKVINTQNSRALKKDGSPSAIVNGDIGKVLEINNKKMIVLFSDPERKIVLSKNDPALLHAYCITCHKFQGSEAPVIIIPVHKQFNYFMTNAWIYTAISRGKDIVITIGHFATIERAIRNRIPNDRFTMLKERIDMVNQDMIDIEFDNI